MSNEHTQPMPADIAKAVVAVMGKVKKLAKDTTNKHGGYNYVSVDQFFDQVGSLMADEKIFVLANETNCETTERETTDSYGKTKRSMWLTSHYEFFLFHESGASYGPINRTVQVSATGPQSYGSAISFAEKYFLRSLFKIPTGEQDADADAQEGLPSRESPRQPPRQERPSMLSVADSQAARETMLADLAKADTREMLLSWAKHYSPLKQRLQPEDVRAIGEEFARAQAALKPQTQEAAE